MDRRSCTAWWMVNSARSFSEVFFLTGGLVMLRVFRVMVFFCCFLSNDAIARTIECPPKISWRATNLPVEWSPSQNMPLSSKFISSHFDSHAPDVISCVYAPNGGDLIISRQVPVDVRCARDNTGFNCGNQHYDCPDVRKSVSAPSLKNTPS